MHRSPHSKVDAISPLSSYRGVIMSKMWSILYKGELGLIRYSDCIDFRMPTASHETDQTSRITLPHALSYAYYMLHMTRITSYHFISLHITSTNKAAIDGAKAEVVPACRVSLKALKSLEFVSEFVSEAAALRSSID